MSASKRTWTRFYSWLALTVLVAPAVVCLMLAIIVTAIVGDPSRIGILGSLALCAATCFAVFGWSKICEDEGRRSLNATWQALYTIPVHTLIFVAVAWFCLPGWSTAMFWFPLCACLVSMGHSAQKWMVEKAWHAKPEVQADSQKLKRVSQSGFVPESKPTLATTD